MVRVAETLDSFKKTCRALINWSLILRIFDSSFSAQQFLKYSRRTDDLFNVSYFDGKHHDLFIPTNSSFKFYVNTTSERASSRIFYGLRLLKDILTSRRKEIVLV